MLVTKVIQFNSILIFWLTFLDENIFFETPFFNLFISLFFAIVGLISPAIYGQVLFVVRTPTKAEYYHWKRR